MSTIAGILEGKTGNYFKLDDIEEDSFLVIENIDPKKTEIRVEKVPNKNKKDGEKDDIEYYHILGRIGDVEKDLSLTFTALKQLAAVMPQGENWRGYSIKCTGKKGSGKNIKYGFQVLGKTEVPQSRLPTDSITDSSGALLADLKKAAGWDDRSFWDMVGNHVKTLSEGTQLVDKLKKEGRIVNDNGMWRVTA